jgi:Secretory lipase
MKIDSLWMGRAGSGGFLALLLALTIAMAGCGNGSSSGTVGPAYPAPFDRAKGEGKLIGAQLVTSYATATTESASDTTSLPGLDTFYSQLVCNGLDQQDCSTNTANLDTPEFGNFDLSTDPIGNNPLGIQTVDGVKIDYVAINVDGTALTVSGGVDVPEVASGSLKGVILYFHGTTVQRSNVPSTFTPTTDVSSGYTDSILLAAMWASQGYLVVMPDYIGLGDDTADVHPYVAYPRENARSGLAMLKAARAYLKSSYDINGRLPLFITGYSEGGAYALEAAHLMQQNPLYASALDVKLREVAPVSGFFDLSGTGLPYLFDNISTTNNQWYSLNPTVSALSKPYLSAYLALSFAHYSGIAPTDIMADQFYNCPDDSTDCGASHNLDGLYFTAPQSAQYDAKLLTLTYALATFTGWSTDNNAVTPLLTQAYADGLMHRDMSNPLYRQIVSADTYLFMPKFPVILVSLRQDSVVTRRNTDVAYTYFIDKSPNGPYKEDLIDNSDFLTQGISGAEPIDHTSELPFLTVLVLNEFNLASE